MGRLTVGASRPPHPPAGTFSALGRRDMPWNHRQTIAVGLLARGYGTLPLLPSGEKVPVGRMRGASGIEPRVPGASATGSLSAGRR